MNDSPIPSPEDLSKISPENLLAVLEAVKQRAKEELKLEQAQAKAQQNVKVSARMRGWSSTYYNEAHAEQLAPTLDKMITTYRLWEAGGKKAGDLPKNIRFNYVSFSQKPTTIRMKIDQSWEWLRTMGDSAEARANKKIKYRAADYQWLEAHVRVVATKEGLVLTWCLDDQLGSGFFQAEELDHGTPVIPEDKAERKITLDNPKNFGEEAGEIIQASKDASDKKSMPWRMEFSKFLDEAKEGQALKIENKLTTSEMDMIESAVGVVADDKKLVIVKINTTGAFIVCSEKMWEHSKGVGQ